MNKPKMLNGWLWKWHIIAGIVCIPFIALLCITGSIYLFKSNYNDIAYKDARFVEVPNDNSRYSYSSQLSVAEEAAETHIMSVRLPTWPNQSTVFKQHAKGHATNLVYVNPYTNQVTGSFEQKESLMHTVRKLHGELLLGMPGTLIVELVASWFIVLALTGIFVWWPKTRFSMGGFFSVRTNSTRRVFWRDMHSVLGFWMSAFMLIILAGGMPWTEVFGENLKWVQKQTDSGYPQHWRNAKGLESDIKLNHQVALSLDDVIAISETRNLSGNITIKLPMKDTGVYTISNRSFWLDDQHVIHLDQYSGAVIKNLNWSQVGVLMNLRQVFMRLHQGEYGVVSLIVVLLVSLTFFIATLASIISYIGRKPKGRWGLPEVPEHFNAGIPIVLVMVFLGALFPTFGLSVILILITGYLRKTVTRRSLN